MRDPERAARSVWLPVPRSTTGRIHTRRAMDGIHYGPGEGESLFGGRIVLKSGLEQLTVTESWFATARPGADLHFHREHADSFYVLEGELAIRIGDEEHLVGPGGTVSAPPGFVHGFRSTMPTRFLNFHTPDARFAEHLRELDRGEPGGFDSVDAEPGDGLADDRRRAAPRRRGRGAAREPPCRHDQDRDRRSLPDRVRARAHPRRPGPAQPHRPHGLVLRARGHGRLPARRREASWPARGRSSRRHPGVAHAFRTGPDGARMLNVHAPSTGFHERLRAMG